MIPRVVEVPTYQVGENFQGESCSEICMIGKKALINELQKV